ncbi:MAG TPA: hypothetical protein ENN64_01310, partial [bacterium]|nr:hypothetical protein [bacterium]
MHIIQKKILEVSKQRDITSLSLRALGKLIDEEHPQKVKHHLTQLEKKNLLQFSISDNLLQDLKKSAFINRDFVKIPIIGSANCGKATLLAEEEFEGFLTVSSNIVKRKDKIFALKASGDSMNQANIDGKPIKDGDYVIVDSTQKSPSDGDYVVSIIDGSANIKKFSINKKNGNIILLSESTETHSPIFIHKDDFTDYLVSGTVIGVLST